MGRHDSKHRPKLKDLSAEERKDRVSKIKESVLKVFRARLPVPVEGENSQCLDSSTDTGSDEVMNNAAQPANKRKVRRRKTRAQRNRSKPERPRTKLHRSEHSALQDHMRKIDKISNSKVQNEKEEKTCSLSQSRITRKLGLFNQAKKSNTIVREPIQLSEKVRKKTNEDMRQILNLSEAKLQPSVPIGDILVRYEKCDDVQNTVFNETTPNAEVRTAGFSGRSSKSSRCNNDSNWMEIREDEKVTSSPFPSSPSMPEIASQFQSVLKVRKSFTSLDYLRETREDLYRLLKQNAPIKSYSPAVADVVISLKSVTSGTAQRTSPQDADVAPISLRNMPNRCPASTLIPRQSSYATGDTSSLLHSNDNKAWMVEESDTEYTQTQSSQHSDRQTGRHRLLETHAGQEKEDRSSSRDMNADSCVFSDGHVCKGPYEDLSQDSSRQDMACHHLHHQQQAVRREDHISMDVDPDISAAQYHRRKEQMCTDARVEYMPSLHDQQHTMAGPFYRKPPQYEDMLDFIDHEYETLSGHYQHHPEHAVSYPYRGHIRHGYDDIVYMIDSQDAMDVTSDISHPHHELSHLDDLQSLPLWAHHMPPPLTKPPSGTPSPPDKLYPRKLY